MGALYAGDLACGMAVTIKGAKARRGGRRRMRLKAETTTLEVLLRVCI